MEAPDPYSVRCEECQCSFAPETKNCVHCGRPLGGGLIAALRSASGEVQGNEPAEVEEPSGRSWTWTAIVIAALAFQLLRACSS